ncbi:PAAR domain-containing protein [Holophaga foetida]|uniref:PAAR domain-containing protein n=1 Tax=Holophaga foetida TaxID=35839 RepID=UPI0002472A72|nr:PAAR domain-containing protein [Holophaga foetida]
MRGIIRLGDSTSHGGKVISASSRMTILGVPVALLGDTCTCPIRGHNNCTIVEGVSTQLVDGIPVAFEGCKTSCGATLISSMGGVGLV